MTRKVSACLTLMVFTVLSASGCGYGIGARTVLSAVGDTAGNPPAGGDDTVEPPVVPPSLPPVTGLPPGVKTNLITDGSVYAIARASDGTTYIGGSFTYVGPMTGHFVPTHPVTGVAQPEFPQVAGGSVRAVAPDGAGGWFIGGYFTHVGGLAQNSLAHILSDGAVDEDWDLFPDGEVNALAVSDGILYVGGDFEEIGGASRNHLAAIAIGISELLPWDPSPIHEVMTIAVGLTTVYVGGSFSQIGVTPREKLAAFNKVNAVDDPGLLLNWDPSPNTSVDPDDEPEVGIYAIAVGGGKVFVTGNFLKIGAENRGMLAAFDEATGSLLDWNPSPTGSVNAITVDIDNETVYVGGWFESIANEDQKYIASFNMADLDGVGLGLLPWIHEPNGGVSAITVDSGTVYIGGYFGAIGDNPRRNAAAVNSDNQVTAWNPNAGDRVRVIAVSGGSVFVGGGFSSIGGKSRNSVAAFDPVDGALTDWDPNASSLISAITVSDGTVYLGGWFSQIGGQNMIGIAAVDAEAGALVPGWTPPALSGGGFVSAVAVGAGNVYIGGSFTTVGDDSRNNLAALSVADGSLTDWDPNANSDVNAIALRDGTVYVGGWFSEIGGESRASIAAVNAATGVVLADWNPGADSVKVITVSGDRVYIGGSFNTVADEPRVGIAALDAETGALQEWDPGIDNANVRAIAVDGETVYVGGSFDQVGGSSRKSVAALSAVTGAVTDWDLPAPNDPVSAIALSDSAIYVGGDFYRFGAEPRTGLASFDR